jgi:hypothetical protein
VQKIEEEFWFVDGIEFLDNNLTNGRQNNRNQQRRTPQGYYAMN